MPAARRPRNAESMVCGPVAGDGSRRSGIRRPIGTPTPPADARLYRGTAARVDARDVAQTLDAAVELPSSRRDAHPGGAPPSRSARSREIHARM